MEDESSLRAESPTRKTIGYGAAKPPLQTVSTELAASAALQIVSDPAHDCFTPRSSAERGADIATISGTVFEASTAIAFAKCFQRIELALQQCGIHEVCVAMCQVLAHYAELGT